MKKLIFIFSMLITAAMYSQTTIEYNFETGDPPLNDTAQKDHYVVFKVNNINRFIYDVSIVGAQEDLHKEGAQNFSQILTKETENSDRAGAIGEKAKETVKDDQLKQRIMTYSDSNTEIWKAENRLNDLESELNELKALPDSVKNKNEISTNIRQFEESITELETTIDSLKTELTDLKLVLAEEYNKSLAELIAAATIMQAAYDNLENSKTAKNNLVGYAKMDGITCASAKIFIENLTATFPFLRNPSQLMTQFNESYLTFKSTYNSFVTNPAVLNHIDSTTKDVEKVKEIVAGLHEEVNTVWKSVDKAYYEKLFSEISQLTHELENPMNYFVASAPVQAKMDIVTFDVKIERKEGVEAQTRPAINFKSVVDVKGGTKIDFSTGFGWSQLRNESYSISPSSTDSTMSVITQDINYNVGQVSLVSFMHISCRTLCPIKPSLTFGLGLGATDITMANFYLGGSVIIGKEERFIISSGVSLRQIDYLNGKYSLNKEILTSSITQTELTQKTMRAGCFVGVSYNLTNKQKEVPKN